jgi:hypothetical protein
VKALTALIVTLTALLVIMTAVKTTTTAVMIVTSAVKTTATAPNESAARPEGPRRRPLRADEDQGRNSFVMRASPVMPQVFARQSRPQMCWSVASSE